MSTEIQLTRRNWRILHSATRDERLSRGSLAILAHILDSQRADEKSTAVRQDELAAVASLTRSNVSRALAKLVDAGFLSLEEKGDKHRPARYRARMPEQVQSEAPVAIPPSDDVEGSVGGIIEVTGAIQSGAAVILTFSWQTGDLAGTNEEACFDAAVEEERAALINLVEVAGIEVLDDAEQLIGTLARVHQGSFQAIDVGTAMGIRERR